ncbi:MAG: putative ATP-dependent zinc protease [Gammaproteobacteria bacterium]
MIITSPSHPGNQITSGVRTSFPDAREIEVFRRHGESWVRFLVPLRELSKDAKSLGDLVMERPIERIAVIKRHARQAEQRYVVALRFCIDGLEISTPVVLSDRREFDYPLLLGRLSLKDGLIVDARNTFANSRACPANHATRH